MSDGDDGLTSRVPASRQVFRREGEYWTIVFEAATFRLRDLKGLRHIVHLLTHPHTEIDVTVLDGRDRRSAATSAKALELARVNVTRAIAIALKRIAAHHPGLGLHLRNTVRTGARCAYRPDPRLPVDWES